MMTESFFFPLQRRRLLSPLPPSPPSLSSPPSCLLVMEASPLMEVQNVFFAGGGYGTDEESSEKAAFSSSKIICVILSLMSSSQQFNGTLTGLPLVNLHKIRHMSNALPQFRLLSKNSLKSIRMIKVTTHFCKQPIFMASIVGCRVTVEWYRKVKHPGIFLPVESDGKHVVLYDDGERRSYTLRVNKDGQIIAFNKDNEMDVHKFFFERQELLQGTHTTTRGTFDGHFAFASRHEPGTFTDKEGTTYNLESFVKCTSEDLAALLRLVVRHYPFICLFKELDMTSSSLGDAELEQLCQVLAHPNCRTCVTLKLRQNKFTNIPLSFGSLTQLRYLDLCDNHTLRRGGLCNHNNVYKICRVCSECLECTGYGASCCNHTPGREGGAKCGCGEGQTGCSKCGRCETCMATGAFEFLRSLTQLQTLKLNGTNIKDVTCLQQLNQLEELDLGNNGLQAENVECLSSLTQLKLLNLRGTDRVTSVAWMEPLVQLEELTFNSHRSTGDSRARLVSEEDIASLRQHLSRCKITVIPPRYRGLGAGDIGIFGHHSESMGIELLHAVKLPIGQQMLAAAAGTAAALSKTIQECDNVCRFLNAASNSTFVNHSDEHTFLNGEQCARLIQKVDSAWEAEGKNSQDFKQSLSSADLSACIGVEAAAGIVSCMENYVSKDAGTERRTTTETTEMTIVLRRCCEHGRCIKFHTDHSLSTMQVPLNGEHEYEGGKLVYATYGGGLSYPLRPAGSATLHRNDIAHGVTTLNSGVRYGLFLLESKH